MEVGDGRPFTPPPYPGPGGAYPGDRPMVLLPHWPVGSRHPAAPRILDGASKAAAPPAAAAADAADATLIPPRPLVATPWVPTATLPRRSAAPVWTAAGELLPTAAALRRRWADGVAWPARVAVLLPAVADALPAAAGGVVVRAAATLLAAVKPDFVDVGVAGAERALRRASTAVREGDLPAAVAAADGLTGLSREVVASWVADARARLLVAQAARVVAAEAAVQASASRGG